MVVARAPNKHYGAKVNYRNRKLSCTQYFPYFHALENIENIEVPSGLQARGADDEVLSI